MRSTASSSCQRLGFGSACGLAWTASQIREHAPGAEQDQAGVPGNPHARGSKRIASHAPTTLPQREGSGRACGARSATLRWSRSATHAGHPRQRRLLMSDPREHRDAPDRLRARGTPRGRGRFLGRLDRDDRAGSRRRPGEPRRHRGVLARGDPLRLRPRRAGEDRGGSASSAQSQHLAAGRHLRAARKEPAEPHRQHHRARRSPSRARGSWWPSSTPSMARPCSTSSR